MLSMADETKLPTTWVQHFNLSEKILASMPYKHFRVNIYQNSPTCYTRYFYSPIALLDQQTIISHYNHISHRTEVSFRIELWNEDVENHVISYLKKIVGSHIEDHQVQMIPFDSVQLSSIGEPHGYRLSQDWTPFQLNKSLGFTLICSTLEDSQILATEMKNHLSLFRDFRLKFSESNMAPHNYALNIRLECIRNSEWVAKLERRFPLTDSMLLNGDDLNHLLSESVQEVVKENIRQSQALSPGSRSAIRAALEKMFEVQQVSTLSSGWDSVYWHIEDQRPDRISEAINHTYAQLDETSQHQVLHALNCFPENSQKDVDMDQNHKWSQNYSILKMLEAHRNTIEWSGNKFVTRNCMFYRVNFACLRRLDNAITVDVSTRSCLYLAINVADYPPNESITKPKLSQVREQNEPSGVEVGDFLLDLLAKGSYLNLINEEGATFLHLMLANCSSVIGKVEIYQLIEELLDRGADLSAVDGKGASILHYAARYSLPEEVILLLLERGADLNVVDDNDKTILHYAARCSSSASVIQLLLERGADVDAVDANGATVLHSAASASTCSVPVIQLLLSRGADIQAQDKEGGSVLHWAAGFCSCVDVIELLLDHGAELNAVDNYGTTVLHYAAVDSSTVEVVELLLKKGADLHAIDQEGKNVLHYARENTSPDVVQFLRAMYHKSNAIASKDF